MIINHNMQAINANRQMGVNAANSQKSMEKLSSGLRINRAGDDAAGLAISEKMRGQIRGLDQAQRNAQDGISMIQTAEGALQESHSILQRMRELAVQSANDTNTADDRAELQKEVDQLAQEITRISNQTEFNEQKLLDGSFNGKFHIGANQGQNINVTIDQMNAEQLGVIGRDAASGALGSGLTILNSEGKEVTVTVAKGSAAAATTVSGSLASGTIKITVKASGITNDEIAKLLEKEGLTVKVASGKGSAKLASATKKVSAGTISSTKGINISSQDAASTAIETINSAIKSVSEQRSNLGAIQNRLEHTINNLGTSSENLTAAESRVRDVDMAKEMMNFTKNNVLNQAAQAMLAQANQQPNQVLQLLQ